MSKEVIEKVNEKIRTVEHILRTNCFVMPAKVFLSQQDIGQINVQYGIEHSPLPGTEAVLSWDRPQDSDTFKIFYRQEPCLEEFKGYPLLSEDVITRLVCYKYLEKLTIEVEKEMRGLCDQEVPLLLKEVEQRQASMTA